MLDRKFLKFGAVGIIGVGIDFFVTWLFKEKIGLNKYISNALGFSFAVVNNFLLNRYWTFGTDTQPFGMQFFKFILIAVVGLGINSLLLFLMLRFLKLNFYLSKLFVIGLVFIWNFSMNYLFTFH